VVHSKRLGLFRQPRTGSTLSVDGRSISPVNNIHKKQTGSLCVFKSIGDHLIYLVLYVDDMLLIGNTKEIIQDLKTQSSSKFDMKDLGASNFILGIEIKRD
jgi:hypothetical protein